MISMLYGFIGFFLAALYYSIAVGRHRVWVYYYNRLPIRLLFWQWLMVKSYNKLRRSGDPHVQILEKQGRYWITLDTKAFLVPDSNS